jgi:hypothetical protein
METGVKAYRFFGREGCPKTWKGVGVPLPSLSTVPSK